MHYGGRVLERDPYGAITRARFDALDYNDWGRLEVIGVDGALAWSNPFPLPRKEQP
jgi:hypothetical protein